jgi:hypothetical protein
MIGSKQWSAATSTCLSLRTTTSSPGPPPAGCRSVGNAITRIAPTRRMHLVLSSHDLGSAAAHNCCRFRTNPAALAANVRPTADRSLSCVRTGRANACSLPRPRCHSTDVLVQPITASIQRALSVNVRRDAHHRGINDLEGENGERRRCWRRARMELEPEPRLRLLPPAAKTREA